MYLKNENYNISKVFMKFIFRTQKCTFFTIKMKMNQILLYTYKNTITHTNLNIISIEHYINSLYIL